MSDDGPTSPDDPEWVDEIVRRALERAGASDPSAPSAAPSRPSAAPTPQAPAPEQTPATPAPAAPPRPVTPAAEAPPAAAPAQAQPPRQPAGPPAEAPPAQPQPASPAADVRPTEQPAAPRVTELPDEIPAPAGQQDQPRLPTADDPVSAYPLSEPGQQGHIAGAAPAPRSAAATMPYPDDDFDDARFEEAVGATFDQSDDGDPIGGRMRGFLEWGAVVVGALAVALLIKTFLMQAYFIPSGSMLPTLEIGDRVLVNKLSYDFGDLGRGDLVVFNRPPNQAEGEDDLIKRVIALPGEVVEIRDGQVFITTVDNPDQQRLEEPYLDEGISTTGLVNTEMCASATATSCEIPEGHVFVMGDNRPGSKDSRVFGPISEDLVVGRAFLRVWPLGDIGFL